MMFKVLTLLLVVSVGVALAKDATEINKVTTSEVISTVFSLLKDDATTRGLARLDASLKSALGNPLTGLVYAASLAVGVITLLAFYESPLSPLPVPSLPKPPLGRFPPEHPIWPPISKHPIKVQQGGHPGQGGYSGQGGYPGQGGNGGGGYAGAASNMNQAFVMPNVQGKNPFAGYEKVGLGNSGFGLNNIEHNFNGQFNGFQGAVPNGFQGAASNVYPSFAAPPQIQNANIQNIQKRVNAGVQAGRPLSSQLPVIQRKEGSAGGGEDSKVNGQPGDAVASKPLATSSAGASSDQQQQ